MMQLSRRDFVRYSMAGAGALALVGRGWSAETAFLKGLGACRGVGDHAALKAAGYDYIEAGVRSILVPDKPDDVFAGKREEAVKSSLPVCACNGFLPGSLRVTGPETKHEAVLEYADTAFRRAKEIGISVIVFGSSGSRKLPDGFPRDEAVDQFVAVLKKMGPLAEAQGVTVVIEPLNTKEDNFVNTVVQGAEIAEKVNHPGVKLLADIYHMLMNGETADDIRKVGHLLRHVHIAEKEGRASPGVHGEDFVPFLRALKDVGYAGRMSVECRWKNFGEEAAASRKYLGEQLARV